MLSVCKGRGKCFGLSNFEGYWYMSVNPTAYCLGRQVLWFVTENCGMLQPPETFPMAYNQLDSDD